MFEPRDLVHVKNLQRLLTKVKAELDMQEVLAAGDVLRWVVNLHGKIEGELKAQEQKLTLATEASKIVPAIEKTPEDLPKKRGKAPVKE